jgi:hypothetical protein
MKKPKKPAPKAASLDDDDMFLVEDDDTVEIDLDNSPKAGGDMDGSDEVRSFISCH